MLQTELVGMAPLTVRSNIAGRGCRMLCEAVSVISIVIVVIRAACSMARQLDGTLDSSTVHLKA